MVLCRTTMPCWPAQNTHTHTPCRHAPAGKQHPHCQGHISCYSLLLICLPLLPVPCCLLCFVVLCCCLLLQLVVHGRSKLCKGRLLVLLVRPVGGTHRTNRAHRLNLSRRSSCVPTHCLLRWWATWQWGGVEWCLSYAQTGRAQCGAACACSGFPCQADLVQGSALRTRRQFNSC